jgi:tetratricopeptide (TPR) repeat protein
MILVRNLLAGGSLLLVLATSLRALAEAPTTRPALDLNDLARLAHEHPGARALFDRGEAALTSGAVASAAALFGAAAAQAPESALAARRNCEVLVKLERRSEALAACREAVRRQGSPMDFRASVTALMAGPGQPTSDELAQAILLAHSARETRPDEPWGYAAECDIAKRLNDVELGKACLAGLQRVAPDDPETRRFVAELGGAGRVRTSWLSWGVLAALTLGSLLHAFLRARRRVPLRLGASVLALVLLAFWPQPASAKPDEAAAGSLSKWPVNEADPGASLPSARDREADPVEFGYLLMDLTDRAEAALARGDHRTAIRYYQAIARAVPDSNVAFSKLCASEDALDERDPALASCRKAIGLPGVTTDDFAHFVHALLSKPGTLEPVEVAAADEVVKHLNKRGSSRLLANQLQCRLGEKLGDALRLEQCSTVLAQVAPKDPGTIASLWSLAVLRGERARAQELLTRARQFGLPASELERMQRVSAGLAPAWRKLAGDPRGWACLALLCAAAFVWSRARRSRSSALA